jgi:hypothetical protein
MTAIERTLVRWEITRGIAHRVFEFDSEIRQVVADEKAGFWIITDRISEFMTINDLVIPSLTLSEKGRFCQSYGYPWMSL